VLSDSNVIDQPYELSDFEQQKIADARRQVENGEVITQEDVFKKVGTWLKK